MTPVPDVAPQPIALPRGGVPVYFLGVTKFKVFCYSLFYIVIGVFSVYVR